MFHFHKQISSNGIQSNPNSNARQSNQKSIKQLNWIQPNQNSNLRPSNQNSMKRLNWIPSNPGWISSDQNSNWFHKMFVYPKKLKSILRVLREKCILMIQDGMNNDCGMCK